MNPSSFPRRKPPKSSRGFTLIELSVVVAIMALLVGVAVVKLRGPYRRANFTSAKQLLAAVDRQARRRARDDHRPYEIAIRARAGELAVRDAARRKPLQKVRLGGGARIDLVLVRERAVRSAVVRIPVGPLGQTPSYAVKLKGPGGTESWLLFAGRTGQMLQWEHDREIRQLLSTIASTGANAD